MPEERLQKVLAASGVASRRASEALIAAGRVTVDGKVARIGQPVDPTTARIAVDGRPIGEASETIHLVLHKPPGVTSTVHDRHADRTVLDLVPTAYRPAGTRLYPVGRLDRDSEGLILLTNDGPWAERVLHPRFGVEREYAVALRGPLSLEQVREIEAGIELDEGVATVSVLRPQTSTETGNLVALLDRRPAPGLAWYRIVLTTGWKRQVRRMLGALGMPVERLVRVRIGQIRLGGLASGAVRTLKREEIARLAGDT
jgi:23S rRNA pseudouridine2605 synthase